MSSGGLRGLEHPPKVWHNSQLSSCVTTIVTDKQQLIAKTNNKLTGLALNGSFSLLLGLKQPSLSSICLRERVNKGRGQRFGGVAKILRARSARVWLSTYLPQILDTPLDLSFGMDGETRFFRSEYVWLPIRLRNVAFFRSFLISFAMKNCSTRSR